MLERPTDPGVAIISVCRIQGSDSIFQPDELAVEEPMEIRLGYELDGRRMHRSVSITMRTPGQDRELAAGFLFTEGIIAAPEQVMGIRACDRVNAVRVVLRPAVSVDLDRLERKTRTERFSLDKMRNLANPHSEDTVFLALPTTPKAPKL
jgi:FdhD protein